MFIYHSQESAPEESKAQLAKLQSAIGMIPNLHKILAEAPATLDAYIYTFSFFTNKTSLTYPETQVVLMTSNFENRCHYCIPAHTWGMHAAKLPQDIIDALRNGTIIPDEKLEALRAYTKALLDHNGHIGDERLNKFLAAGYTKQQALEVLCGLAAKLISNYANAIAHTELDSLFEEYKWQHPTEN